MTCVASLRLRLLLILASFTRAVDKVLRGLSEMLHRARDMEPNGEGDDAVLRLIEDRQITSRHSRISTAIRFRNECTVPVRLVWLDYNGRQQTYGVLQPGATQAQPTYCTHPWTFYALAGDAMDAVVDGCRIVFAKKSSVREAAIRPADRTPWTVATHARFPAEFREKVRALLVTHHQLRSADCPATPAQQRRYGLRPLPGRCPSLCGSSLDLGDLPPEMVLLIVERMSDWHKVKSLKPLPTPADIDGWNVGDADAA